MGTPAPHKAPQSRLEVNFLRVLRETQQMANGTSTPSWSFDKLVRVRRVVVLYGSQTGTAEEVAERVAREARRRHYAPVLMEMNSAHLHHLQGDLPHLAGPASQASGPAVLEVIQEIQRCISKSMYQQLSEANVSPRNASHGEQVGPFPLSQARGNHEDTATDTTKTNQAFGSANTSRVTAPIVAEGECQDDESKRVEEFGSLSSPADMCELIESDAFCKELCSRLPPLCVVCVVATTGQGDDPDNMKEFFARLWSQRRDRQLLKGVKFGVLALGDSSYQKFNYSGKRLNNLLQHLGAQPVLSIGLADDQHDLGPDFVVDTWLTQLWSELEVLYPLPQGVPPLTQHALPPPRFRVKFLDEVPGGSDAGKVSLGVVQRNYVACPLTKLERVTAPHHFQDVRLAEFDVSDISYKHKPGDVLYITPENLPVHVKEFLDVVGLDGSLRFQLQPSHENPNVGDMPAWLLQGCSVEECVTKYFDIMSVPKRYFFELLSFFTTDDLEKEKFLEFSSAVGQQDLYDYCNRPKRSIVEVLADFPYVNKNIPFEYLFDVVPRLKPRAYSIASSSVMLPNKAQVLMAVVNYHTILKRPRLGVCSNWLATLPLGHRVLVSIKKGSLKFPLPELNVSATLQIEDCTSPKSSSQSLASQSPQRDHGQSQIHLPPVVMIATGTGVAPFRSYIQERVALKLTSSPMLLFFGCRGKSKDFFFAEEWRSYDDALEVHTAFSRDQEDKVYVQHCIRDQAQRLWALVDEGKAQVYFAGNAKRVPIDVSEALAYVCKCGLRDQKLADAYFKNELGKRYQTETWA